MQVDKQTHHIKCWPEHFSQILSRVKNFELRKDDRGYQVNDILVIEEYDPATKEYTGAVVERQITIKITNATWLQPGVCALGICEL